MRNMDQLRKLVTEKRMAKNLARDKISELLKMKGIEYAESSLSRFENGKIKNIRIEVLNALCDILNIDKKTAFSLAGLNNKNLIPENENFEIINGKEITIKAFNFDSERDGRVDFDNFKEVSYMVKLNAIEEFERNIAINILGNAMKPYFYEGDNLLIKKEKFVSWEELNKKIVLYKYNDVSYLRRVVFIEGKGYLESFNRDVYGKIEINLEMKYIGRVVKQFNMRDLSNTEF